MNLIKNSLVVILLTLFFTSCNSDYDLITDKDVDEIKNNSNQELNRNANSRVSYSSNSLVVMFKSTTTSQRKALIRNAYDVQSFELCKNCANQSIELWKFKNSIQIEPKKETIDHPTETLKFIISDNIVSVDFNYNLKVAPKKETINNHTGGMSKQNTNTINSLSYQNFIKPSNNGITIAVFDTGINPFVVDNGSPVFTTPFLYNASGAGIANIATGWDFVNSDNDAFDDDIAYHGTAVTSIIRKKLESYNIENQIMPLKIADANGKVTYFNLVCSLSYALENRVKVLNMSLGWYTNSADMNNTIFETLLINNPKAILVCSAGNNGTNNEVNKHWPSNFGTDQIIAVGSRKSITEISSWSNYGATSVDFLATGEGITFLGNPIEGTSFAVPIVTARVAQHIYNLNSSNPSNPTNIVPLQLIENIKVNGDNFNVPYLIKHNKTFN